MEIFHKVELINGIERTIIYVRYPDNLEFGLDFNSFKKNVKTVSNKIKEYITKNVKNIKDDTALLVLNGIVVGTLVFSNLDYTKNMVNANDFNKNQTTTIEASISNDQNSKSSKLAISEKSVDIPEEKEEHPQIIATNNPTSTLKKQSNKVTTAKKIQTAKPSNSQNKPNSTNGNTSTPSSTSQTSTIPSSKQVSVKLASGNIITLSLEDYIIGVVGSEMPAEFNSEALKAQAVAARTYALKQTSSGRVLTATTADQVYKTNNQLKSMWGNSFDKYYNKVKNAVSATKGVYMTYNGKYIDALYFSTSNGKTEDAVYVWGNSIPYLKPVDSSYDINVRGFKQSTTISMSKISQKLGVNLTSSSQINILSKTAGNRVEKVSICGKQYTGVQIRTLLGLRSTDFEVSQSGNNIIFTTKGFGHGVGMSQYGANGMAKNGYSYTQILKHYYTGISINSL